MATNRIVTARSIAPIARMMGYSPIGISKLCAGLMDEWSPIGSTRITVAQPIAKVVYASRPNWWPCDFHGCEECYNSDVHGLLAFSVGQAISQEEVSAAKLVAERISRRLCPPKVRIRTDVQNGPVTRVVEPLAPRDHR